ncbi:MAG: transketolase C-terminal domain-containing protein [Chloroflexota bacterium]
MATLTDKRSIRQVYGETLVGLGERDDRIVVVDADMAPGTFTHMFRERFPERFFDVGIAEQNLVDVGAGFALGGHIPFVNTFAFLLALRAAEQVRTSVCWARTNVKIAAGYGGVSGAMDGASHCATNDLAVVRSLPNIVVMSVSDGVTTRAATIAAAEHEGPVYIRLSRATVEDIHLTDFEFRVGNGVTLRPGGDVALVGTGVILGRCLAAAEVLSGLGVDARVIEIHTLKPIDCDLLQRAAEETGAIVTVEEHNVIGGLGAAVCEVLAEACPVPIVRVGINDVFGETGPHEALLDRLGMGIPDIVSAAKRVLKLRDGRMASICN